MLGESLPEFPLPSHRLHRKLQPAMANTKLTLEGNPPIHAQPADTWREPLPAEAILSQRYGEASEAFCESSPEAAGRPPVPSQGLKSTTYQLESSGGAWCLIGEGHPGQY